MCVVKFLGRRNYILIVIDCLMRGISNTINVSEKTIVFEWNFRNLSLEIP